MNISQRLKDLLKINKIKQRELAKRIDVTEVSITRYVKGDRNPRLEELVKIAKTLNVSVDFLIGNDERPAGDSLKRIAELQREIQYRDNRIAELEQQVAVKDGIIRKQAVMLVR